MGKFCLSALIILFAGFFHPQFVEATERGYQPRDCGFDMNRNGIPGEPEDCNVCNGASNDGDADGSAADTIYVSCAVDPFPGQPVGTDHPTCGAPGDPCATLAYAFGTIADGPGDGAEDIVCFRNTCQEDNLSPRSDGGGVPGTYSRTATGSAARDWHLPADPVMLVGWDVDGDGIYPPHDPDHAAVLIPEETCPGLPNQECPAAPILNPTDSRQRFHQKIDERAIYLNNEVSYVELAHFAVRDYGRYTLTENSGFFDLHQDPQNSVPSTATEYVYVHDIEAQDLNRDSNFNSRSSAINNFNWRAHYVLFENLEFTDNGHWFARGGGGHGPPDYGPFRWQNISLTLDACKPPSGATCDWNTDPDCPQGDVCLAETGCEPAPTDVCNTRTSTSWKIWGHYRELEVLDSVLDANFLSHPNAQAGGRARGIDAAQCTQDWTIRNNELVDFNSPIELVPESAGACSGETAADGTITVLYARPVTDVVIDRNWIRHPAPIGPLDAGITLKAGGSDYPGQVLGDITITNNTITSDQGLETCISIAAGHGYTGTDPAYPPQPVPGAVTVVHNTCYGPITLSGAIVVGHPTGANQPYMQENVILRNNLIGGINGGTRNVAASYAPAAFVGEGNVYDPDAGFRWDATSGSVDLATWASLSGDSAVACIPSLRVTDGVYSNGDARPLNGDVHLHPADVCAQDAGVDASAVTVVDFDGESRPQGSGWDAGSDEAAPPPLDQPPTRFAGAPTGTLAAGTTSATLSLRTDQPSTCDLANAPGVPYGGAGRLAMTADVTGTIHTLSLSGLADGDGVERHARCQNSAGVTNPDDYLIAFQIASPSVGAAGHWPFDEPSGCAVLDVAAGRDGTLAPTCPGDAPARVEGIVADALEFDGTNDYVEVAHDPALAFTGSFTAAAWIRPVDFGDGGYGRILAKQKYAGGFGTGYSFYLGDQPTGNPPSRRTLCANIDTGAIGCGDDDIVTPGIWQHVTLVFDDAGDEVRFYADGQLRGGFAVPGSLGASTVPLRIGDRDDLLRSFRGTIDDVRLWDRVLSDAEIADLPILQDQPAVRSQGAPTGNLPAGTGVVDLELDTNKPAECRFADTPGVAFEAMTAVFGPSADRRHHLAQVPVSDDRLHRYYVRCEDDFDNVNEDDYEISFFVGFHPTELAGTAFFVESRHGLTLTHGTDPADFENYCEPNVFPDGCVRRWEDQSGYVPPGDPTFVGRDFGQDDAEKPGLVPDCLNGLPCVRGGRADESPNWGQDLSFEIELGDEVRDLPAGLSAYLLVRPVVQASDFAYFGFAGTTLTHRVADDSLHLEIDDVGASVTGSGAVAAGAFQLIEIHRDAADQIQIWVDGTDVTLGSPILAGGFDFRFLFSVSRVLAMHGDVAAFLLVDGALDVATQAQVRGYFAAVYGVPSAPPIAHWPFDETGGCLAVDVRGGRHGTLAPACSGDEPSRVTGRIGDALDFDGANDYVEVVHDSALAFTGSFTAAAWIRPDGFGDSGYGRILAKQKYTGGFGGGYSFYVGDNASGNPAANRTVCANIDTSAIGCAADDSVTVGIWQHVALVFDDAADQVRFYVDGVDQGGFAASVALRSSTVPLRIGDRDDLARSFDGAIDDVRLWDRALSGGEIAALVGADSQPPQRFDGSPSGMLPAGTASASLTVRTDQPAVCDVATGPGVPYGDSQRQLMVADVTGSLHTLGVTGLADGDVVERHVRCAGLTGVANPDDYLISFEIAAQAAGPVARWSFDETTGCTALDAGSHDGALAPSCPADGPARIAGSVGGALDFDGVNDYVEVADDPALAFTGSFTAAAWIRPVDFGDSSYGRILAKQQYVGGFGPGYSFYLTDRTSGNPSAVRSLCANIDTSAIGCAADDSVTLGVWQHVVLVFDDDADEVRFYVDGVDRGGFTASVILRASTVPLRIGDRDDLSRSFYGAIDEVQLWNRALSAAEIAGLPGVEVTTLDDTVADDGQTSVREAIAWVNDSTLPAGTVIRFAPGLAGTVRLDHPDGTLRITQALHIQGGGVIEVSGDADGDGALGSGDVSVFEVAAPGEVVTLEGLRITGGWASGADIGTSSAGGGVLVDAGMAVIDTCHFEGNRADAGGAVAVDEGMEALIRDSVFVGNQAGIFGGALVNNRAIVGVVGSTFTGNSSGFNAGAIYNLVGTVMSVSSSTIEGNTAGAHFGGVLNTLGALDLDHTVVANNTAASFGGGLGSIGGALTLRNTTVSGNQATSSSAGGGGLWADSAAQVELDHCTVAGNSTAGAGGGLMVASAIVSLSHTLVADNTAGSGPAVDGTITSLGFNLFDQLTVAGSVASDLLGANADLGPLADNGGPTQTHLLGPASEAIDAGDPALTSHPDYDQRGSGFPRVVDGDGDGTSTLDIGAVEIP